MKALLLVLVADSGAILKAANDLLEEAQISYVYGGYQVGDGDDCQQCNECLTAKTPRPAQRLTLCPVCRKCSVDCSHFANLIYQTAGSPYPYLDTRTMLDLTATELKRRYGFIDLGTDVARAQPADLIVYDGHVVVLERTHEKVDGAARWRGDIVHATGGRDIKRPGEGIQRERFVNLESFRGPVRRILRLAAVPQGQGPIVQLAPAAAATLTPPVVPDTPRKKLRPVIKKNPEP